MNARDDGFTLVEVLLASVLMLMVAAVVVAYFASQTALAQAQPDAADVQQRARAAADVLARDLATAGGWAAHGGVEGMLACCLPSVQPRRIGLRSPHPAGTARGDVLTIVRLASGAIPTRLREPLMGNVLALENGAECPSARPLCGLEEDDTAVIFDLEGRHDFVLIGPPGVNGTAPLTPRQAGAPHVFPAGSYAAAAETRTYYFDPVARQVRQYDGHLSDVPVVDEVVAARFEYWGEAGIPARLRLETGVAGCWFDADGLPRFGGAVAPAGAPLVMLALEDLRDGPWCGAGENRFDADLLRIRRVRAVVRVSATPDAARGTGAQFVRAGSATRALRLVPDFEVIVDVAPRNLNGDR